MDLRSEEGSVVNGGVRKWEDDSKEVERVNVPRRAGHRSSKTSI